MATRTAKMATRTAKALCPTYGGDYYPVYDRGYYRATASIRSMRRQAWSLGAAVKQYRGQLRFVSSPDRSPDKIRRNPAHAPQPTGWKHRAPANAG
jgi:hypothetical protein